MYAKKDKHKDMANPFFLQILGTPVVMTTTPINSEQLVSFTTLTKEGQTMDTILGKYPRVCWLYM